MSVTVKRLDDATVDDVDAARLLAAARAVTVGNVSLDQGGRLKLIERLADALEAAQRVIEAQP